MDAILWALLKNEVNKSNKETTDALANKADLVDGKVPLSQLPSIGSSSTYQPFDPSWTTNSSTVDFCEDIINDENVTPAMAYMGEVSLWDMPLSGNAELVVEIMEGPASGPGKSIHLILTSGTDAPYHWEYTYWKTGTTPHMSGWIGFQPYSNLISFKIAMANTDDIYTAYAEEEMNWDSGSLSSYNIMYDESGNIVPNSEGAWQYYDAGEAGILRWGNIVLDPSFVKADWNDTYYFHSIVDGVLYSTYEEGA